MATPSPARPAPRSSHRPRRRAAPLGGALAAALVLLVTACGTGAAPSPTAGTLPEGSSLRSLSTDGTQREYRAYRPQGLKAAAPLVMVFHGYTWTASRTESEFGWNALADAERFVVVYPEGLNEGFNAGRCCGISSDTEVDDVGAALAILNDVATAVPLDTDRLYATGFSNGGAMTYRMACETDRFAAFGPVAGGLVVDCKDAKPASILHVHGLADTQVPFEGDSDIWRTPTTELMAQWRKRDDCAKATTTDSGPTHLETSACASGREVNLLTIDGLDHAWPTKADGVDATSTLWEFFRRHPRGH